MTGGRWAIVVLGCVALGLAVLAVVRTSASPVTQQPKPAATADSWAQPEALAERVGDAVATTPPPVVTTATAPHAALSGTARAQSVGSRDRARADAIRTLMRQRAPAAPAAPRASATLGADVPDPEREAARKRLRQQVREQYFPMVKGCYEALLEQSPKAAGKFVLEFAIVGDSSVGGVVDRVKLGEGTTLTDPELLECLTESLFATLFDPPPDGARETTVVFPIELAPN
jgi:hypothetical protein